ncbi:MAG: hypothetical protein WCC93_12225, partial [Chthoniobacterales bacterium]
RELRLGKPSSRMCKFFYVSNARIGEESDLVPVRLRPQIEDLNSSRALGPVLKPQIINEDA